MQKAIFDSFPNTKGSLPFRYIGVLLSSRNLTIMQCQPLVKKILARMDGMPNFSLMMAARIQLIKSVLFRMQTFWSQVFLPPKKILKMIKSTCKCFLWTGKSSLSKRALVIWDKIFLPKVAGGWNIVNLELWNKAAILKIFWNLSNKKDVLWVMWVHSFYIKGRDINTMPIPNQASWITRKVFSARN